LFKRVYASHIEKILENRKERPNLGTRPSKLITFLQTPKDPFQRSLNQRKNTFTVSVNVYAETRRHCSMHATINRGG